MPGINCSDRGTRIDRSAGRGALETVVSIVAPQQKECGRSITLCFAPCVGEALSWSCHSVLLRGCTCDTESCRRWLLWFRAGRSVAECPEWSRWYFLLFVACCSRWSGRAHRRYQKVVMKLVLEKKYRLSKSVWTAGCRKERTNQVAISQGGNGCSS